MSEQSGSLGTTTNGKHPIADNEPTTSLGAQRAQPYSAQSVDERLEALMQTIRTWDWRSPSAEPDPPPVGEPGQPLASAQISSVPTRDHKGPDAIPVVLPRPAAPNVQNPPAPNAQNLIDPAPRHARANALPGEQPDAAIPTPVPSPPEMPQGPPTPISAAPVQQSAVVDSHEIPSAATVAPLPVEQPDAAPPSVLPSAPEAAPDPPTLAVATPVQQSATVLGTHEAPSTAWSFQPDSVPGVESYPDALETKRRARIRVVVLCVAALVVVLLIIGAIRLFSSKSQGSGPSEPPPTTAVTTTTSHTAASADQAPLPIPSAELTQYERAAQALNVANTTATKALVGQAALTPGEVVPVATIYSTALNTYSLELAYIQWPASLETAVKADQAQLVITANYLKSIDTVSPTGLNSWIAQLRAQATTTETMDNALRQELDLPKTTAFPT
jgi:hypothetical protein